MARKWSRMNRGVILYMKGSLYTYSFSLYAPKGIPEAGEYEYKLPEGITAADFSAEDITADDGTVIGHLSVADDGTTRARIHGGQYKGSFENLFPGLS